MYVLLRWSILTMAIMAASYVLDGVYVRDLFTAFWAAALLGVLNVLLRPILLILTLPLTILTLGLFTFVINAFLLMMASGVVGGFAVDGFGTAVIASLIISVINWFLSTVLAGPRRPRRQDDFIDLDRKDDDRWE